MHEEPGFLRIGSLTRRLKPTPPGSGSIAVVSPRTSGTTGLARLALPPGRSIGVLLGAGGVESLPIAYSVPFPQPPAGRVVEWGITSLKQLNLRPDICETDRQQVADIRLALQTALKPQTPERLSARLTAFLAHWFIADLTTELRGLVLGDWLREFEDTPAWALDHALRRYFRDSKAKPFPCDIRPLIPSEVARGQRALAHINSVFG